MTATIRSYSALGLEGARPQEFCAAMLQSHRAPPKPPSSHRGHLWEAVHPLL